MFVFMSLMEYFIILFGMRYDKHWRHAKKKAHDLNKAASPRLPRTSEVPVMYFLFNGGLAHF